MDKTIIYYTDNSFEHAPILRERILKSARGIPVISVSFKPIDFGKNIVVGDIGRSHESIYKQILIALRAAPDGIIYFCEHDNVYHYSYFEFVPPKNRWKNKFYYNRNRWRMRLEDGLAVYYEGVQAVSQLVAHRKLLLKYYTEVENGTIKPHFHEPGVSRKRRDIYAAREFATPCPNIDIRHPGTITGGDKFTKTAVRKTGVKRKYFQQSEDIPYWGKSYGRPTEFINEICEKE